ncbi:thioredoxin domain-containing protein [Patescibacteria group bacterium]|nr:thioredoxin domain-containing protein [Patescibacteria group bacterium]
MSKKEINAQVFIIPLSIVIAGLIIAFAIIATKGDSNTEALKAEAIPQAKEAEQENPTPEEFIAQAETVTVSIDDDAIKGNKEAKVAVVEFSDFECPYCKRFWEQTLPPLTEKYIDSDKAFFVYRDLPLDFHDPKATEESIAAECAGKLGGDAAYYQYHDLIYENTKANGKGISEEETLSFAKQVGVKEAQFKTCLLDEKMKEEVKNDAEDAAKIGMEGTPGFVVGKVKGDGTVEGIALRGAYPQEYFELAIEKMLAE